MGLGVVGDREGGVLLVHPAQALGDLILLAPGLGHDGHRVARLSEGDILQSHDLTGVAQRIAGLDLLDVYKRQPSSYCLFKPTKGTMNHKSLFPFSVNIIT